MDELTRVIRKIRKKLGYKGWLLQYDSEGKPYLSKFGDLDDNDNFNEYRVYFLVTKDKEVLITRKIYIPKYRYHQKENVDDNNRYIQEAIRILETYEEYIKEKCLIRTPYFAVNGVV